jgi:UDP:flavonoid glycosyltransferase YjiC (YdhE family)
MSNGGSSTGYQALAAGTPVLGIATNFDQFLAQTAIAKIGAGLLLRAGTLKAEFVRRAVHAMLAQSSFRDAARTVATDFARYDSSQRFASELERILA